MRPWTLLVTGQIDRVTNFERGTPLQYVLSSCSHAGIVNVLRHARRRPEAYIQPNVGTRFHFA